MAGDWIKMRIDLQTHPKVVRILSATRADKFRVIGGLHAVWCVFDTHSEDGFLRGYSPETLDHIIGWDGFSQAMIDVDWLLEKDDGLQLPEFTEHNGKSGKRRAEDMKRKRASRNSPQSVRKVSVTERTECGLEKEKDIKEKIQKENRSKRFKPPTVEDVRAYCLERKNNVDPVAFVNHYESTNWHRGKTKISDWQACVRTWEGRDSANDQQQPAVTRPSLRPL